jgi:coproporphyrinogen III oxidase-like Fe-S oxidoreductase
MAIANRNLAIGTSSNKWISSSRSIAHKYLKTYIESLDFTICEFEDLKDEEWKEYVMLNKVRSVTYPTTVDPH